MGSSAAHRASGDVLEYVRPITIHAVMMKPVTIQFTFKSMLKTLLYTAGFNTGVALLLKLTDSQSHFLPNLIYSQCIGLTICCYVMGVISSAKTRRWQVAGIACAILAGAGTGTLIASDLTGSNMFSDPGHYRDLLSTLTVAVVFGTMASGFYFFIHRISDSEKAAQQERLRRLRMEKEIVETRLKLLQAQIEPHFLFNTLSNVLSLIETDKVQAAGMLTDLTRFLRATLERTRDRGTTLGQELEVIRAYLNILKIRMGDRLTYQIDVPEKLLAAAFAPMLLQPLVENAVWHGLDPLIDGGKISIGAEHKKETLHVWVSDTGAGLQYQDTDNQGFGLCNIKQRLKTLYGKEAHLMLEENPTKGLKAIIEVPIEHD